jgi:hypothetical protein
MAAWLAVNSFAKYMSFDLLKKLPFIVESFSENTIRLLLLLLKPANGKINLLLS